MPDDLPEDVDARGMGTISGPRVRRHAMIIEVMASPCLIADPRSAARGSLPALARREPRHAGAPAGCRWAAKRVRRPRRRSAPRSRGIRTSRPWPERRPGPRRYRQHQHQTLVGTRRQTPRRHRIPHRPEGQPQQPLRASVRRHRSAQGDRSTLRSIRPKRARRPFDASVDHTEARFRNDQAHLLGPHL